MSNQIDPAQIVEMLLDMLPESDKQALLAKHAPAPTVDEVLDHVRPLMYQLRRWFDTKIDDLFITLEQRGRDYGEEVLVVMGEPGMHEMCRVKMHRADGSMSQGDSVDLRHDTRLDIAGYQLLILAMDAWKRNGGGVQII